MVSKELEQLLNGGPGYPRERAPEPLLLPRIATRLAPKDLANIAYTADIMSRRYAPCGWPALADATAQAIASRHVALDDMLLRDVFDSLPQLPIALIRCGEAAGQRADVLVGSDAANHFRMGLGSPEFILREAIKRVFSEPHPPRTRVGLMTFIRNQIEADNTQNQRNLLAYFLPLVVVEQRQWMLELLLAAPRIDPGLEWSAAAAASRMAGLLEQDAVEQFVASLQSEAVYWTAHVRKLLAGDPAVSVFLEVTRALPCDGRLEHLLNDESDPASLAEFVDGILDGWGGAPAPGMFAPAGSEGIDSGFLGGAEAAVPEPRMTPSPPASRSIGPPDPEPVPAATPERSLQTQVFADDGGAQVPVTQGFMKGARHDVRFWIGPETKHSISADQSLAEPAPDEQEVQKGYMEIAITLVHDSLVQTGQVSLPIDRSKPSRAAVFSLDVAHDAMFVSAEIWLQHKGRVIQYLRLNGLAVDKPDNTTAGIVLKVESVVRALPEDASGSEFGMAMVKRNDKYIVFGPRGAEKTEVSLQGSREIVEQINKRLFTTTKGLVRHSSDNKGTSWVKDHDEEALQLLREMARWGNALYDTLKKEGALARISETIQFVNLDESDIVPIEYVYDRGYPSNDATLCDGFREAEDWSEKFAAGACTCPNRPLEQSDTLCPMGFWSLSKIIERQPRPHDAASAGGFVTPPAGNSGIALSRHALLAAAPNVNGLDVDSIKALLEQTYPNRHKFVADWLDWKTEIRTKSPKLLILLPHHGEASQGHTDFLEIGSPGQTPGRKLYTGLLKEDYVTDKPDEPGPIVLLLGCETAQSDLLPYHTFARDFLANRASVVVATQSSVLGQHAAPVANEFIRQLLASNRSQGSFGRIMRDVRRRMFAAGYLMSLALVSFGDSDWQLGETTTGDENVPG